MPKEDKSYIINGVIRGSSKTYRGQSRFVVETLDMHKYPTGEFYELQARSISKMLLEIDFKLGEFTARVKPHADMKHSDKGRLIVYVSPE